MERFAYADSDFEGDSQAMLDTVLDLDDLGQQADAAEHEGDEFEADLHRLVSHATRSAQVAPRPAAKKVFTPRRCCR